jgi:hypothetical protein
VVIRIHNASGKQMLPASTQSSQWLCIGCISYVLLIIQALAVHITTSVSRKPLDKPYRERSQLLARSEPYSTVKIAALDRSFVTRLQCGLSDPSLSFLVTYGHDDSRARPAFPTCWACPAPTCGDQNSQRKRKANAPGHSGIKRTLYSATQIR